MLKTTIAVLTFGMLGLAAVQAESQAPAVWVAPQAQPMPEWLQQSSLKCGIPPIPPIGCQVGDCVCDQYGNNCRWTFVCSK
jgi:hypothetical protein